MDMDDVPIALVPPLVTVIMPILNEAKFIAASLSAVLAQQYPAEWMEILIADGGSTDDTIRIIRSLPGADRVRIVPNAKRIQAAGMNLAIQEARGDIIIRVDGHAIIEPDYVAQCVRVLSLTGADNVGGSILPVGTNPTSRAIAVAARSQFAVPGAFHIELPKDAPGKYSDTVYMGAWRRETLLLMGGFNERLAVNEDYELNHRILRAGGRIYFSPAIRSWYCPRERYRLLVWQYFRYGRGKSMAVKISPGSLRWRHLVPPAFIVALVTGAGLAVSSPVARVAIATLFLLYLALALVFGLITMREFPAGERSTLPRTVLVFPLMHLSWGVGFCVGLIFSRSSTRQLRRTRASEIPQHIKEPVGARQLYPDR